VNLVDEVELGEGVRAGFTGRHGGVSAPPWDGLNLGVHVGDDLDAVARNRELLAGWAGVPVAFATQVHGARVRVLDGPPEPDAVSVGEADALVTAGSTLALAVLVADCAPVLLADSTARVVAVAHAGRAGLVAGVVQATVEAMCRLGASPARLRVVVGPCIAGRSYEVPAELRDQVGALVPAAAATTDRGTPAIDLVAGVRSVLAGCGVPQVSWTGVDTLRTDDAFSHRRDGPATGRSAGIVRLLPVATG